MTVWRPMSIAGLYIDAKTDTAIIDLYSFFNDYTHTSYGQEIFRKFFAEQ